ncbi:MAG: DUF7064 domain-containing protein [Acidimicrobiales bacterium]
MGLRLDPIDEHLHDLGPEENFNESMYFNVVDPASRLGAFFRLANRANEGTGEMTTCIYLPGGRVAFSFRRPKVTSNDAFDAAGMRFDVVTPFEELHVHFEGKVCILDDPLQLADPKAALTANPWADAAVELTYRDVAPPFGGEPDEPHERPGEEFAKGHYEQLVSAKGTISVGDESFEVDGYGLRDHSWGPRYWQAPWYYRWLTGNVGADFGFMASRIARKDGPGSRGGFVWEGGKLHLCDRAAVETTWTEGEPYHAAVRFTLGERHGERLWVLEGRVLSMVPLRNRRTAPDGSELVTRIGEGLTEWTLPDGRVGFGLAEYLDQIVDGHPAGLAE